MDSLINAFFESPTLLLQDLNDFESDGPDVLLPSGWLSSFTESYHPHRTSSATLSFLQSLR